MRDSFSQCVAIPQHKAAGHIPDLRALYKRIEGVKDTLTAALNEFKVEVAREHPTAKALQASEERLTSAINKLTERIDRWLERHP